MNGVAEVAASLSVYQRKVLIGLGTGWRACTSEGTNYRCWLEKDGEVRTVRKDTLEVLHRKNLITLDEVASRSVSYVYKATPFGLRVVCKLGSY